MIANKCPSIIGLSMDIHCSKCLVKGADKRTFAHLKPFVAKVPQLNGSGILSTPIFILINLRSVSLSFIAVVVSLVSRKMERRV